MDSVPDGEPGLTRALVTQSAPLRVLLPGSTKDSPARAPAGVSLAAGARAVVAFVDGTLVVLGVYPSATAGPTPAQTVLIPGDDGSVWQLRATAAGSPYTVQVR